MSHPRLAEAEAFNRLIAMAALIDQPIMIFHVSTAEGAAGDAPGARRRAEGVRRDLPAISVHDGAGPRQAGRSRAPSGCARRRRARQPTRRRCGGRWRSATCRPSRPITRPTPSTRPASCAPGPNPNFKQIANGMPGLESRLPLLFDAMVSNGRLGVEKFVELTATAPARIYNLKAQRLARHRRRRRRRDLGPAKARHAHRRCGPRPRRLHALCRPHRAGLAGDRAAARRGDRRRRDACARRPAPAASCRAPAAPPPSRPDGSSPRWTRPGISGRCSCREELRRSAPRRHRPARGCR